MRWGIHGDGFDELIRGLSKMGELGERNLMAATLNAAGKTEKILKDATIAPKKGGQADVADFWRIELEPKGASVVNPSEKAVYLEFGVGIYNEGPGHKGYIVPRQARNSAWAQRYRAKHGKEPPRVLSWVDEDTGKRIFARKVKGFKAVRMVRNNLPRIGLELAGELNAAATHTLRGERYV